MPAGHNSGAVTPTETSADRHTTPASLAVELCITGLARFLSGASIRWVDCQPDTCQRIYFANHTSHLDVVLVWSSLPRDVRRLTRPVAAKDYWSKGRLRPWIAKAYNAMLIDRRSVKVHQSPVDLMLREMGEKHSVIMFPEGGRTDGQRVGDFKSGLYYLCKKRPDLEAVPVYLHNIGRVLPRDEYLPVPLLSSVTFGPPLWLESGETKADFLQRARESVLRLAPHDED